MRCSKSDSIRQLGMAREGFATITSLVAWMGVARKGTTEFKLMNVEVSPAKASSLAVGGMVVSGWTLKL